MVNHLLETSHPLSSFAVRLRASARHPVFVTSLHHYLLTSSFPPGPELRLATGLVPIRYQGGQEFSIAANLNGSPLGVCEREQQREQQRERNRGRLQNCTTYRRAWGSSKSLIMTLGMGMKAETDGGCPTMSVGTRQILQVAEQAHKKMNLNGDRQANIAVLENIARVDGGASAKRKPRVFVAAENRLLREALSRMLLKNGEIEVVGIEPGRAIPNGRLAQGRNGHSADVLPRKPKRRFDRGSSNKDRSSLGENSPDWRDRRGSRVPAMRACGSSWLSPVGRFGG